MFFGYPFEYPEIIAIYNIQRYLVPHMNRLVQKWVVTFTLTIKQYIIITCTKPCIVSIPLILHINFSLQMWVAIKSPDRVKLYSNKITENRVKGEKASTYIQILIWNNLPCTLNCLLHHNFITVRALTQDNILYINFE